MLDLLTPLPIATADRITAWLNASVRPALRANSRGYATGRLACWLSTRPEGQGSGHLATPDAYLGRLQDLLGWTFDYCLATYSGTTGTGISAHRDAGFAEAVAYGITLSGECRFSYWHDRQPSPGNEPDSLTLTPGTVIRFDCKHLHAAEPTADRWALNFWRAKPARA